MSFSLDNVSAVSIGGRVVSKIEIGGRVCWENEVVLYDGVTKLAEGWSDSIWWTPESHDRGESDCYDSNNRLYFYIHVYEDRGSGYYAECSGACQCLTKVKLSPGKKILYKLSTNVDLYVCKSTYPGSYSAPSSYSAHSAWTVSGEGEITIDSLDTSEGDEFYVVMSTHCGAPGSASKGVYLDYMKIK